MKNLLSRGISANFIKSWVNNGEFIYLMSVCADNFMLRLHLATENSAAWHPTKFITNFEQIHLSCSVLCHSLATTKLISSELHKVDSQILVHRGKESSKFIKYANLNRKAMKVISLWNYFVESISPSAQCISRSECGNAISTLRARKTEFSLSYLWESKVKYLSQIVNSRGLKWQIRCWALWNQLILMAQSQIGE